MRSHFGLFNTSHRRSEQQSSYRRSQSSTGTATNSTQHPALSRTFDDPSFIPLANSDLYIDHDEDIQRTLTQLNRSLPQTGAGSSATRPREMRQGHDTLLNHPLSHDEPSHFHTQSHVAVPDALYCYQDTTLRPSAAGNEACPSSPRPTRTRHIFQTEGLSNIQQPDQNGVYRCFWLGCTDRHGFSRDLSLWRHIKAKHLHPKSFKCLMPNCGRLFDRHDSLRTHQQTTGHCI